MQSKAYPVRSFLEYVHSINLVYRLYVQQGYMKSNPCALRFLIRDAFPTSAVLSVKGLDGSIIGTITPYMSELESLADGHFFEKELKRCGGNNDKVVEGTKFSVAGSNAKPDLHTARLLIKGFFSLAHKNDAESIFMVVNPKHVSFWEQVVNFRAVSDSKEFPDVCGHPGVLMHIPVNKIKQGVYTLSKSARRILFDDDLLNSGGNPCEYNTHGGFNFNGYRFSEEEVLMLILSNPESLVAMSDFEKRELHNYFPRVASVVFNGIYESMECRCDIVLGEFLDKILLLLSIRAQSQGVSILCQLLSDLPVLINADSVKLTQLIMSQLTHVIDHSCAGDIVRVFCTSRHVTESFSFNKEQIILRVDNGVNSKFDILFPAIVDSKSNDHETSKEIESRRSEILQ